MLEFLHTLAQQRHTNPAAAAALSTTDAHADHHGPQSDGHDDDGDMDYWQEHAVVHAMPLVPRTQGAVGVA